MFKIIFFICLSFCSYGYEVENTKYLYVNSLYDSLLKIEEKIGENNTNIALNSGLPILKIYYELFDYSKKEEITRLLISLYELKNRYKIHYEEYSKFEKDFFRYINVLKERKEEKMLTMK